MNHTPATKLVPPRGRTRPHPHRSGPTTVNAVVTAEAAARLLRRGVAIAGLLGIGLVHLVDAPETFHEMAYIGWGYLALTAGSLVLGQRLVRRDDGRTWWAVAWLAGLGLLAYVLSRTTGLPGSSDDIGSWFEPLGIVNVFTEVVVIGVAIQALRAARTPTDR